MQLALRRPIPQMLSGKQHGFPQQVLTSIRNRKNSKLNKGRKSTKANLILFTKDSINVGNLEITFSQINQNFHLKNPKADVFSPKSCKTVEVFRKQK